MKIGLIGFSTRIIFLILSIMRIFLKVIIFHMNVYFGIDLNNDNTKKKI